MVVGIVAVESNHIKPIFYTKFSQVGTDETGGTSEKYFSQELVIEGYLFLVIRE